MDDAIYKKVAKVLDTLPNGFPATESGVEIKLLKKIFTPEQADLFCDMRLTFETVEEIAQRTGRPLEGLKEMLISMAKSGQLFRTKLGRTRYFKMLPWAFGIYEFQLGRLDREFAELNEEYGPVFGKQFFSTAPPLMQVLAIEEQISEREEPLPYEKVSSVIENGQSFLVNDCICKKEQGLLDKPCDRPLQVCLAIAPIPGIFDNSPQGRVISKGEAYELLKKTEEEGLVHLSGNVQYGPIYICNCCKCCCGVLRAINELGIPAAEVVNSHYYAEIDPEKCLSCGLCSDKRCQVGAIEEGEDAYRIIRDRCIGCGLCITTCPAEAVRLLHKDQDQLVPPPLTEEAWFEERGRKRGVD
ncbi:4Fe-4S binding protein, partial [Patescibacteria group bacterium]|nr:4Fe-4S binding protein [Patescibacteria group bacterium]